MSQRRTLIAVLATAAALLGVGIWIVRPVVKFEVNDGTPWLFVKDGHGAPMFDSAKILE